MYSVNTWKERTIEYYFNLWNDMLKHASLETVNIFFFLNDLALHKI